MGNKVTSHAWTEINKRYFWRINTSGKRSPNLCDEVVDGVPRYGAVRKSAPPTKAVGGQDVSMSMEVVGHWDFVISPRWRDETDTEVAGT